MRKLTFLLLLGILPTLSFAVRPKDEARTVTTPATDDYFLVDGATNGTGKSLVSLYLRNNTSYGDPAWLTSLAANKLTGVTFTQGTNVTISGTWPSLTISATGGGSGDMLKSVYDTNSDNIVDVAALANSVTWTNVSSKPTTVSGFGITDAQPLDADLTAVAALTTTTFGRSLLTQADAAATRSTIGAGTSSFSGAFSALSGIPTTLSGHGITDGQPLDSDLTAIAALTTTTFGRSLLTQADAASTRTTIGAGTSSFDGVFASLTSKPTTRAGYGITDAAASTHTHAGTDITSGLVAVANGGTGTATPGLVQGTNVTITGTWPNQTIAATAGAGGYATVQSSGTNLTTRTTLNFTGAGVTAVDNPGSGRTDITIAGGGGSGTVTSASVVTANGVSGSVATATTTPAITLTLGAITPTSVNGNTITTGTGTLTLGAAKTATISNTLTFSGTDASTLNIGTGGTLGTAAYTAASAYEVPLTFSTGLTRTTNTITIGSGAITNAMLAGSIDVTTKLTGVTLAAQEPAHTGDVTNTAGSLVTTLANIPAATPAAGSILYTAIAAPSTPAAGKGSIYVDSTSKNIAVKDDAGVVKHGVQTQAGSTNNFVTAINDAGVASIAQPAFTNLSGTIAAAQIGAGLIDLTTKVTGVLPVANYATGTPTGSKFVRDDGVLAVPAGGGNVSTSGTITSGQTAEWNSTTTAISVAQTGTGNYVKATSPTIATPTFSGVLTLGTGAQVISSSAMGALAIDTSKRYNTKSIAVDSVVTFNSPPASFTIFGARILNTDTNPHTVTFPTTFSINRQASAATVVTVPASGRLDVQVLYDGTDYTLYGDPVSIADLATGTPAGADLVQISQSGVSKKAAVNTLPITPAQANSGTSASSTTYWRGDNTWATPSGSGTVTSASVVSANGFAGTVATATSTPAITISTSITGLLKGNGTAISAASAGTDYENPLTFSSGLTRTTNAVAITTAGVTNAMLAGSIDLTSKVTGILPTANGGTGNAFFTVGGASGSAKTYVFPNVSCNILTDNAAVGVVQGGTGGTTAATARVNLNVTTNAVSASAIDWALSGTHSKTLGANATFTFSNATDGQTIVVAITNTASNWTVTWPTVSWSGGTAPTQTVGAKTDIYTFVKVGTTIYGSVVQNF